MGRHIAPSRTATQEISPTAIKYTLAKRIAIAEDVRAGYSYREVAARHGVALCTVHNAAKNPDIANLIDDDMVERRRKSMAKIYEYQADCGLSALTPEKWEKERAASIMTAVAIATDKARLIRGESTENVSLRGSVENINFEVQELRKKREQLFGKATIRPESANYEAKVLPVDDKNPITSKSVDNQQQHV